MKECWYKFGEGKYTLFQEENTYCGVCEWMEFDGSSEITGLNTYMENTLMNKAGSTYAEYLGIKGGNDRIDTSKLYSIMFVYSRGDGVEEMESISQSKIPVLAGLKKTEGEIKQAAMTVLVEHTEDKIADLACSKLISTK